ELFHHQGQALLVQPSKLPKFLFYFLIFNLPKKQVAVLSAKKLIKMARKWQKFAAMQRKRISFPRNDNDADSCSTSSSPIVDKGHFVVYTVDQAQFFVPLAYLKNEVIRQFLSMSEEEFGLPNGGPITLPCDSALMSYIISLIKKGVAAGDLRRVVLLSIPSCCCSTSSLHEESGSRQLLVC
ncbi:hypothetical protein AABB24_028341, partial [Solanum stoloniferum]